MDILNFSQFAWAYSFCQNMQINAQKEAIASPQMKLVINNVGNKFIASIIINNKLPTNNDSKRNKFKIMIDVIPENVSWTDMHQRWRQVAQCKGLDEYYVYAPHNNEFFVWQRFKNQLVPLPRQQTYFCYPCNIRFEHYADTLEVFTAKHTPFLNFKEQIMVVEETQTQLKVYETALQEKEQQLNQAHKRLDMLEQHYKHYYQQKQAQQQSVA